MLIIYREGYDYTILIKILIKQKIYKIKLYFLLSIRSYVTVYVIHFVDVCFLHLLQDNANAEKIERKPSSDISLTEYKWRNYGTPENVERQYLRQQQSHRRHSSHSNIDRK